MAQPKVSYKGVEEPTNLFLVSPRLVVTALIATMLLLFFGSTDATLTASLTDQKNILARVRHSPAILNDSSMPAADIQDFSRSYYSSYEDGDFSLPLTVEETQDEICSAHQYFDRSVQACRNCTTCGPGMQHKINQPCGYGRGLEQICEPCPDKYYQDRTSSNLVQCRRCIICDKHAEIIQKCTRVQDAQCGPCRPGMYYFHMSICVRCADGDSGRKECMVTKPTSLSPVRSDASTATPVERVEIVIDTASADEIGTPPKGTESPTTKQPVHGGVNWKIVVGVIGVITVLVLPILTGFCLYKFVRQRKRFEETGPSAENGSRCGYPGRESGNTVRYIGEDETIQYDPVSQVEA